RAVRSAHRPTQENTMATEGSVATKERDNITYEPATGDAQTQVELPLKLLVLGDFTQREDDRSVEDRAPINVDKDNYDEVLKAQNLSLDLSVPNRLEPGSEDDMPVILTFEPRADLQPDNLIDQV